MLDAVVIGAGMAGIAAARDLAQHGPSGRGLEGRDRVGGGGGAIRGQGAGSVGGGGARGGRAGGGAM